MRITLKVDVDTYRGTREGVPQLLRLFDRFNVRATFLFSLGPDHTGRALRRVFRPGFLKKVGRTSVVEHYGIRTLLYGVLLPGPHIGRRLGHLMREVACAGHEVGIHTYDHIRWQDFVAKRDEAWTRRELKLAADAYAEVFGEPARTHGAAGWQMNAHAFRLEQTHGFAYASDTRGTGPFVPVIEGKEIGCVQLPTTLPTLDELIGLDGCTNDNVHERVLQAARTEHPHGHLYTLHAEMEGMRLALVMERLLTAWQGEGCDIGTMADLYAKLDASALPRYGILYGEVPGRTGDLALQGS